MRYADLASGPFYRADLVGDDRSRFRIGLGLRFGTLSGFDGRIAYRGLVGDESDHGLLLNLQKDF